MIESVGESWKKMSSSTNYVHFLKSLHISPKIETWDLRIISQASIDYISQWKWKHLPKPLNTFFAERLNCSFKPWTIPWQLMVDPSKPRIPIIFLSVMPRGSSYYPIWWLLLSQDDQWLLAECYLGLPSSTVKHLSSMTWQLLGLYSDTTEHGHV